MAWKDPNKQPMWESENIIKRDKYLPTTENK